jgi:catalase
VAPRLGYLRTSQGNMVKIHFSLLTASSVLFDAVYVPGGEQSVASLKTDPSALEFVFEAYKHAKAIGASGSAIQLFQAAGVLNDTADEAVVVSENGSSAEMISKFLAAIRKHRNWQREKMLRVDLQAVSAPTRKSA